MSQMSAYPGMPSSSEQKLWPKHRYLPAGTYPVGWVPPPLVCSICRGDHEALVCPLVQALEFHQDGSISRIEYAKGKP